MAYPIYPSILAAVTTAGLIAASFTDLKTREVPDWLSYGMVASGLCLNLLFSFIYSDYWIILSSLTGLVLFIIIALAMFYTGQWGGGDSKVLMGIGAIIGLDVRTIIRFIRTGFTEFPFLISFLINVLLVGAVYGLLWSLILAFRNWGTFLKELKKILHSRRIIKAGTYLAAVSAPLFALFVLSLSVFKSVLSFIFPALLLTGVLTFSFWIFVKAIEKGCMLKKVTPDKLTEGDWIAKNIYYNGEYICGPRDLGIEKGQIKELMKLYRQKKIKRVLIKEGIPFVPGFLIAYIISLCFGALFLMM